MAIYTERPGGGDDRVAVHRARTPEEARKARAAIEQAGIPIDLPDQAIDATFAANPQAVIHLKVALRDSAKALRAISDAFPPEAEPSPILTAADPKAAAEATLEKVAEPATAAKQDYPASAVDRSARRSLQVACLSIFFPPVGFFAGLWGATVLLEMNGRPQDSFRDKNKAKLATLLGFIVGLLGTPMLWAIFKRR